MSKSKSWTNLLEMLPIPKKTLLSALIALLVLVGGVLGYAIYQSRSFNTALTTPRQQSQTRAGTSISGPSAPSERTDLTDEERQALNPPPPDATDDERAEYASLVQRVAEESNVLVVNNCEPSPPVMLVRSGSTITATNENTVDHILVVDPEHLYTVPAEGKAMIDTGDFGKGPGIYAYGCDLSNTAIGVFLVVEF